MLATAHTFTRTPREPREIWMVPLFRDSHRPGDVHRDNFTLLSRGDNPVDNRYKANNPRTPWVCRVKRVSPMSTRTVDVTVTMSPKLLERLDRHLEEVGEPKRSPWIRAAIRRKLAEEEAELRDEFEEVED